MNEKPIRLPLTRELYQSFARVELDRWDALIDAQVRVKSPAGWGMQGLTPLKHWAQAFAGGLAQRIDLVDEHLALDSDGNGRGFITFTLHWKHDKEFFGLAPTGREGTSVESLILTIREHKIHRIDVADHSVDLLLYLWERGWALPHNIRPAAIVSGATQ